MLFKNICNDKSKEKNEITTLVIFNKSDNDLKFVWIIFDKYKLRIKIDQIPNTMYIKFILLPRKSPKSYM